MLFFIMRLAKIIFFTMFLLLIHSINVFSQQPTEEWVRRFSWNNFGSGISVKLDSAANVYVLLKINTDSTYGDIGLIKYNSKGDLIWSVVYNSPENLSDEAAEFIVSKNGDIYITGSSNLNFTEHIITIKYNSSGILQWEHAYNGSTNSSAGDITLDDQGNVIVTGGSAVGNTSFSFTIKYNSSGDTLWTKRFDQIGLYSSSSIVLADNTGNIYITGSYEPEMYKSHFLTVKYGPAGNLIWYSTYFSDTTLQVDRAYSLALDLNNNVYVIGSSRTQTAGYRANSLIKINTDGIIQWTRIYKGIGNNNNCVFPTDVSVTSDGNRIYYTTACYTTTGTDYITLAYNPAGDSLWVRRFPTGSSGSPATSGYSSLTTDKFSNIYLTSGVYSPVSGTDIATVKYLPDGTRQWVVLYNGPLTNSDDRSKSIVIDTSLNVYITGISSRQNSPQFLWDAATIKYNQPIGIIQINSQNPENFILSQNYPNPFNPSTKIKFSIPRESITLLKVYDILGREVATMVNEKLKAGTYEGSFDASDLSSGIYFYSLEAVYFKDTKKMVLMK
jgi:hypothetical protein